ncbi:MAG: universal stress protein [Crocinitomicaceae bacterium]|nr:universal stress protein [Crocinitomicaceae bacterium]
MFDDSDLKKSEITAKNENVEKVKSIILLSDFSEPARNAIKYAIDAFGDQVEYHLVNAYYARTSSATLLDLNEMLAKESEQGLTDELNWIKETFPDLNLTIKSHSIFGSPVDAIKRLKRLVESDLVVMGTKGASGVDAVLFGSVASTVIRATVIPVISVPPDCQFNGFKEIVFATDGQELENTEVLAPIEKLHKQFNSEITLFSVERNGKHVDWNHTGIKIENAHHSSVAGNDVAEEVTKYCNEKSADLLVILPKHTGFFDRLFHRSISKELVEQAKLPILSLEYD